MEKDHLCLILEQQTILECSIVMQTLINKADKLQPIQVRIDLKHHQITFLAAARGAYVLSSQHPLDLMKGQASVSTSSMDDVLKVY